MQATQLLSVSRKASADEISMAYRELVREYHPDANPDDPAGRRRAFQTAMPSLRDTLQPTTKRWNYNQRFGPARRQEAERELRGEDVSRLTKLFRVDLDRPLEIAGRGRDDEGARDLRVRWTQRPRNPKADKMGQKPPKPPGTT